MSFWRQFLTNLQEHFGTAKAPPESVAALPEHHREELLRQSEAFALTEISRRWLSLGQIAMIHASHAAKTHSEYAHARAQARSAREAGARMEELARLCNTPISPPPTMTTPPDASNPAATPLPHTTVPTPPQPALRYEIVATPTGEVRTIKNPSPILPAMAGKRVLVQERGSQMMLAWDRATSEALVEQFSQSGDYVKLRFHPGYAVWHHVQQYVVLEVLP